MSNYTQTTDFSEKDGLTTADPEKAILGADFDVEFAAISAAIATKAESTDLDNAVDDIADHEDRIVDLEAVIAVNTAGDVYTPTYTEEGNLDSVSGLSDVGYTRVGDIVTVAGRVTLDITTADSNAAFNISLPVASDFTSANQLWGSGSWSSSANPTYVNISFESDATSNDARVVVRSNVNGSSIVINYIFMYRIL